LRDAAGSLRQLCEYLESCTDSLSSVLNSTSKRRQVEQLNLQMLMDIEILDCTCEEVGKNHQRSAASSSSSTTTTASAAPDTNNSQRIADVDGRRFWQQCFEENFIGSIATLLKRLLDDGYLSTLEEATSLLDFFGNDNFCFALKCLLTRQYV
jgi:hypothetical protein